ncbi:MAG: ABC transporter permease [Chloroflexota bacterium]|nr:ABC transporter permease [Chloroflexota bacterium]
MAVLGKGNSGNSVLARGLARWLLTREAGLLILLLAVVVLFWILEPSTRQQRVYWDLLREISPNLIAAIGVTMLMLAGEFDLSIGSMLAVTSVTTVVVFNGTDSMWLGVIAGLATGPIVGSIHGYLVTRQKMNSLVTTLGSLFALRGMVYVYTNKTPIVDENGFYDFQDAYYNNLGPAPLPFVLAIILVALSLIVLTQTEFGRNIYAIGGNETAARVSGIKVNLIKFILFVICASSAAISGMILTMQTGTGYFDSGSSGFELIVIAGVVLGGIALSGGKGSLVGTVLGILILGMTAKGLRLMGVNTNMQLMVTGSIMILAVFMHSFHDRISIFRKR